MPDRAATPAAPLTLIGLCEDYPEESRTIAAAERDLGRLRQLGVRHLRVALGWDGIETAPGVYDWSFWDAFFALADRYDITLLPYVCYTPAWAAKAKENPWRQPPADVGRFADFVATAAARYRGKVGSWELWNEPDNREYWEGTPAEFAALVKAGAAAVRRVDPSAKVVLGGISWDTDYVLDLLADHDIADAIDVINVHDYAETWNPQPIEHIPDAINRIAEAIAEHGDNERIWMAEVGYSDYRRGNFVSSVYEARTPYEHTAAYQAGVLVRMLALAMSTGKVDVFAWYRLNDLPTEQDVIGDVNNRHLGVVGVDGREKPAFDALRQCVAAFGNVTHRIDLSARVTTIGGEAVQTHAFARKDGGRLIVAWRPTASPAPTRPATQAIGEVIMALAGEYGLSSAFDPTGAPIEAKAVADRGTTVIRLSLPPGRTPVLVLTPVDE